LKLYGFCIKNNIELDIDCVLPKCFLPKDFNTDILRFLNHKCGNPLIIMPNLDVCMCPELNKSIFNLNEINDVIEIDNFKKKSLNKLLCMTPSDYCKNCEMFIGSECQGGCLGNRLIKNAN